MGSYLDPALTISDPLAETAVISGLTPGTTYVLDIAAFGSGGETFTQSEELVVATTFGPAPGTARIEITNAHGNMCNGNFVLNGVEAFIDEDLDGVVAGAAGEQARGSYPHFTEFRENADLFLPPERFVVNSASFGRNIAGVLTANLVVAGYFDNCGSRQFVAAHFAVFEENGSPQAHAVLLHAGDRRTFIGGGEMRGAVLESTEFHGRLDRAKLVNGRADGSAEGRVIFVDAAANTVFEANLSFIFDAPIELR